MSEEEVFLQCVRQVFKDSADIIIKDIYEMADGDISSWLFGLNIGYFSSLDSMEWRLINDNL